MKYNSSAGLRSLSCVFLLTVFCLCLPVRIVDASDDLLLSLLNPYTVRKSVMIHVFCVLVWLDRAIIIFESSHVFGIVGMCVFFLARPSSSDGAHKMKRCQYARSAQFILNHGYGMRWLTVDEE